MHRTLKLLEWLNSRTVSRLTMWYRSKMCYQTKASTCSETHSLRHTLMTWWEACDWKHSWQCVSHTKLSNWISWQWKWTLMFSRSAACSLNWFWKTGLKVKLISLVAYLSSELEKDRLRKNTVQCKSGERSCSMCTNNWWRRFRRRALTLETTSWCIRTCVENEEHDSYKTRGITQLKIINQNRHNYF